MIKVSNDVVVCTNKVEFENACRDVVQDFEYRIDDFEADLEAAQDELEYAKDRLSDAEENLKQTAADAKIGKKELEVEKKEALENVILATKKPGKFISQAAFVKFLKGEGKSLTYKCEAENCPLARATGYAVNGSEYGIYINEYGDIVGLSEALPAWATTFVGRFDDEYFLTKFAKKNAKRSLAVMETIDMDPVDAENHFNGVR